MKRSYQTGLFGMLVLVGLSLTAPVIRARVDNCQHISGHIAGQVSFAPSPGCIFTEQGPFTDNDGNVLGQFDACATSFVQEGSGARKLQLSHTYTTNGGDTFTTSDDIVLSPIDPNSFGVNNRATVTGGTGIYQDAFGRIEDHGSFNPQTGEVSVDYHGQICTP